jgi:ABC-type Mn2+/Zn2+ transport system ATPase subunit
MRLFGVLFALTAPLHTTEAFVLPRNGQTGTRTKSSSSVGFAPHNVVVGAGLRHRQAEPPSLVVLFAKSKVKAKSLESLEALESQVDLLDAPLSKKEQKELLKKQKKTGVTNSGDAGEGSESVVQMSTNNGETAVPAASKPVSKKDKMLAKALELEAVEAESAAAALSVDDNDTSQLSKKELKALKKKEEKMAEKAAVKAEKKAQRTAGVVDVETSVGSVEDIAEESVTEDDAATQPDLSRDKATLEDKIRKERPPPRIRVMESAQPGYVSLRLENVGITFRNQEVLKDVTWGVQSGDRIGLVGKNGAGKTTQLRIFAGELEPTTGDVVKSSSDLRTAMLRQEFVDELVKERTLKEEFMSVFAEENQILLDLRDAEKQLESMGEGDTEAMQQILDRMQDLQRKADDKDVYVLESKVKKTMDLMGFTADEADDLVASFSGGWKMRIGLGKVLLREPNILLLGKCRCWKEDRRRTSL